MAGIPAITTRRMDREVKRGLRTKLVHGWLTRRTVAISTGVAECLQRGGVQGEHVRTIWSSVDAAALEPTRPREEFRAEFGIYDDRVVLLTLGALVERKGLDVLLAALARSVRPRGCWALWIAGDGEQRASLERQVAELKLGEDVLFLGRRTDAADLLHACDALVMPSRREGLGVAALEAMAAGRAVVASRVGGLAQVVVDGDTGILVPAGDADELARALDRLIGHPALRLLFGTNGKARMASGFDAQRMVDAYAELYREVLAEGAR
jgi:glycosyltransferase involved in cell wall biosynthesis